MEPGKIKQISVNGGGISTSAVMRAFANGFDYAIQYGDWHKADGEDMPELGEDVLIYCKDGQFNVGYLENTNCAKGWEWRINSIAVSDDYVTYWMSLPEPPEESEESEETEED